LQYIDQLLELDDERVVLLFEFFNDGLELYSQESTEKTTKNVRVQVPS